MSAPYLLAMKCCCGNTPCESNPFGSCFGTGSRTVVLSGFDAALPGFAPIDGTYTVPWFLFHSWTYSSGGLQITINCGNIADYWTVDIAKTVGGSTAHWRFKLRPGGAGDCTSNRGTYSEVSSDMTTVPDGAGVVVS